MNNIVYVSEEYAMSYIEILEILKRMDKEYYEKIPIKLIENFEKFKSKNYKFVYDDSKKLKNQKLMKKTKDILAVLFIDYLATDDEKKIISEKQKEYETRKEKYLRKKYDVNKMFESKKKKFAFEENMYPTIYKKSLYLKIIDKIKKRFYKK